MLLFCKSDDQFQRSPLFFKDSKIYSLFVLFFFGIFTWISYEFQAFDKSVFETKKKKNPFQTLKSDTFNPSWKMGLNDFYGFLV